MEEYVFTEALLLEVLEIFNDPTIWLESLSKRRRALANKWIDSGGDVSLFLRVFGNKLGKKRTESTNVAPRNGINNFLLEWSQLGFCGL